MATQELGRPSRTDLSDLATSFDGELVLPGEARYEDRRSIWNRMIDGRYDPDNVFSTNQNVRPATA